MLTKSLLRQNSSAKEGRESCPGLCQCHLVTEPQKTPILWDVLDVLGFFPPFLFIWNLSQHSFRDICFSLFPAFLWHLQKWHCQFFLSSQAAQAGHWFCPGIYPKCSCPPEAETETTSGMGVCTPWVLFLQRNRYILYQHTGQYILNCYLIYYVLLLLSIKLLDIIFFTDKYNIFMKFSFSALINWWLFGVIKYHNRVQDCTGYVQEDLI